MSLTPPRRPDDVLPDRAFWALLASYALTSVQFWMTVPLAAVTLAERGVPAWRIGLIGSVPWITLVALLPFVPRLAAAIGVRPTLWIASACGLIGAATFALAENLIAWVIAYGLCGAGMALRWIVGDGMITALSPPARRGHLVGLFETAAGATISLGPALLIIAGTRDATPFWIGFAFILAATVATAAVPSSLSVAPKGTDGATPASPLDFTKAFLHAPLGVVLALTGGVVEGAAAKLFPVQAVAFGWSDSWATATVTAFGAGNILTQYPVGRLCDRLSPRIVAMAGLVVLLATALILPLAATLGPSAHLMVLVVAGGSSGSLYTLTVIRAGTAGGGPLNAMSVIAGIGVIYTGGSVLGPAIGGFATEWSPLLGLPVLIAVSAIAALAVIRRLSD